MRELSQVPPLLLIRIGKGGGVAARRQHQIDVDADHPIRIGIAEPARDRGSPIATLRAETRKAEHLLHQGGDTIRHFRDAKPLLAGLKREPVSRQGGRHHREGIARIATESCRIGQTRDDIEKLENRARPAVQQEQRHRVGADASHMQVMEIDAVEPDAELRERIQRGFLGPPVECVTPVFGELAKMADIGAVSPCSTGRRIGKAGAGKTVAEIGDVGVGDTKREGDGFDGHDAARQVG